MKTLKHVNAQRTSFLWLPVLLIFSGLVLAGCGATAPVVDSVNGPDTLETNESGTFEASLTNSDDVDQEGLEYMWDFGDGATGSGLLTTHSFNQTGQYTVQFKAQNEGGADSSTVSVTVVRPPQPARVSTINANPSPATEGEQVRFTSNVSGDSPVTYNWDFGDGSTASGATATHTYDEAGTFTVSLQASNNVGQDTRTLNLTVERDLPQICTTVSEFNAAFFGRNSSTLTSEGRNSLQENLDILNQCPNLSVRVEGFAAPGERNAQSLSEDRARAVAQFYQDNGVGSNRIMTSGEGEVGGQTGKKGGTRQFRRADSIPQQSGM
jgi:outer membrane protein OmpA-like peptidoglycan-associated protein